MDLNNKLDAAMAMMYKPKNKKTRTKAAAHLGLKDTEELKHLIDNGLMTEEQWCAMGDYLGMDIEVSRIFRGGKLLSKEIYFHIQDGPRL